MNVDDSGVLSIHQSDLKDFLACPEQFRVTRGIQPGGDFLEPHEQLRIENDAALIGTICHLAFETDLRDQTFTSLAQLKNWAKRQWHEACRGFLETGVEFRQENYVTHEKAIQVMSAVLERWWKSTERGYWTMAAQDHGNLLHFELDFNVPLIVKREGRYQKINLGGTIDLLDLYEQRVVDYKTASRAFTRWEHQRWGIQETAYTFGAASLGLLKPHDDGNYQFDFRVFVKGEKGEPQSLTVYRSPDQWGWMIRQTENMVQMMESEVAHWPLRDDGWHCSPKWCPIWKDCKGAFVTEDWT